MPQLMLDIHRDVDDFLREIEARHARQIFVRILNLRNDPVPQTSETLRMFPPCRRVRQGEYRIIYYVDGRQNAVRILHVGNRSDDEVYRDFRRIYGGLSFAS